MTLRRKYGVARKLGQKGLTAKLDSLCRQWVLRRDGGRCLWCGATQKLQWSHFYSRRFHSTRWHQFGSMMHCAGCHIRWHQGGSEGIDWWRTVFSTAQEDILKAAHLSGRQPDKEALILWFERELAKPSGSPSAIWDGH